MSLNMATLTEEEPMLWWRTMSTAQEMDSPQGKKIWKKITLDMGTILVIKIFWIILAPLRGSSLVYYFIIPIQLTYYITDILIHLVQEVKSSFSIFYYASVPILPFHVLCFPLFHLTSSSTLSLWLIWKKKKNGRDLNSGPPGHHESILSIRPRRPHWLLRSLLTALVSG